MSRYFFARCGIFILLVIDTARDRGGQQAGARK